ncbi:MAG: IMP dehydrogenase [Halieaceae bacterium]|jgi:IMP dehydrogenase|nr:IMP dehydrogenase [Halieaceae bacterium]
MANIVSSTSTSLKEYRLLPGLTTEASAKHNVSLHSRLCRSAEGYLTLNTPFVSASMQAVSDDRMAIALARLGGVSVIPVLADEESQMAMVKNVKQYKAGFQTALITFGPDNPIREVQMSQSTHGFSTYPVTDNGLFHGKLLGVITDKDFDAVTDQDIRIAERMKTELVVAEEGTSLMQAKAKMIKTGRGFLPIVSREGTLQSVVFRKDLEHHIRFPNANEDRYGRLVIGAAVTTHPQHRNRITRLIEESVDFLVIDASDGYSAFQQDTIRYIKFLGDTPVIAGNVVTAQAFEYLMEAGADAIKVGMGIGSGCITQEAKATGRGQASALIEVVNARDKYVADGKPYVPIIADGGLSSPADICIALALGADTVMMGNYFAQCTESPGDIHYRNGQAFKKYWMEGSVQARNLGRYFLGGSQNNSTDYFAEGVSGWVPHSGSIFDVVPASCSKLKASLSSAGCYSIEQLHNSAQLEHQSPVALGDSAVHNMVKESEIA